MYREALGRGGDDGWHEVRKEPKKVAKPVVTVAKATPEGKQGSAPPDGWPKNVSFMTLRCKAEMCPNMQKWHLPMECPFAHPDVTNCYRRDVRRFRYLPLSCPYEKDGGCGLGDECPYCHSGAEKGLHPAYYATVQCGMLKSGPSGCNRTVCYYYHKPSERRQATYDLCPTREEYEAAEAKRPSSDLSNARPLFIEQQRKKAIAMCCRAEEARHKVENGTPAAGESEGVLLSPGQPWQQQATDADAVAEPGTGPAAAATAAAAGQSTLSQPHLPQQQQQPIGASSRPRANGMQRHAPPPQPAAAAEEELEASVEELDDLMAMLLPPADEPLAVARQQQQQLHHHHQPVVSAQLPALQQQHHVASSGYPPASQLAPSYGAVGTAAVGSQQQQLPTLYVQQAPPMLPVYFVQQQQPQQQQQQLPIGYQQQQVGGPVLNGTHMAAERAMPLVILDSDGQMLPIEALAGETIGQLTQRVLDAGQYNNEVSMWRLLAHGRLLQPTLTPHQAGITPGATLRLIPVYK